jgi:NADH:ubiquinone oxidoreductase subunit K
MVFRGLRRPRGGSTVLAAVLLVAGSICVCLWLACVLVTVPIEQVVRRRRAGFMLLSSFLLIQSVAASIVRRQLFSTSTSWQNIFQFIWLTAACAIASVGFGVLINLLAGQLWDRFTWYLFGF